MFHYGRRPLEGLTQAFQTAQGILAELLTGLGKLGKGVGDVSTAADAAVLDKLDEATSPVDAVVQQYDKYVGQLTALAKASGKALERQSYWQWYRGAFNGIVAQINGLPVNVGSLHASNERMKAMAAAFSAQGQGAAAAVTMGNAVVNFAESAHAVLTTLELAGGATVLVKTAATLLVKEGLKACANEVALKVVQNAAGSVGAGLANYAVGLVVPEEYRPYISVGLQAFQAFTLFKALKTKVNWNGNCFVAGTGVLSGVDVSGRTFTRIEDLRVGDTVLSRDQSDESDDLSPHRVTEVFHKTSDHLRACYPLPANLSSCAIMSMTNAA